MNQITLKEVQQYITGFKWETAPIDFHNWPATTAAPVAFYLLFTAVLYFAVGKKNKKTEEKKSVTVVDFFAALHNLSLSVLSALMLYGMAVTTIIPIFQKYGLVPMICDSKGLYWDNGEQAFWIWVFTASKFLEFIDTWFFILQGKPLTFLHVWHHATVPIHMYLMLRTSWDAAVFGFCFNAGVHVIMYFYYALTCFHIRVSWKILITFLQIFQFVTCFALLGITLQNRECEVCRTNSLAMGSTFTLYLSYLVLFIHFFIKSYFSKDKKGKKKAN